MLWKRDIDTVLLLHTNSREKNYSVFLQIQIRHEQNMIHHISYFPLDYCVSVLHKPVLRIFPILFIQHQASHHSDSNAYNKTDILKQRDTHII